MGGRHMRLSMLAAVLALAVASMLACEETPTATPEPTATVAPIPTATPEPTENGHWQHDPCGPAFGGSYFGPLHARFLHWTGDGSRLVFDQADTLWSLEIEEGTILMIADADADFHPLSPTDKFGNRFEYGFYADVSPDGSKIVYSSCEFLLDTHTPDRFSEGYELVMMNVDGTEKTRITRLQRLDHYPVWSPDGKRIAFITRVSGNDPDFYPHSPHSQSSVRLATLNVEENRVKVLASSRVAPYPPVWSPDSQRLAYIAIEGEDPWSPEFGIWTTGLDHREPVRITDALSLPTWSPDGEELAFVSVLGGEVVVHATNPDGTEHREVWRGAGGYGQVYWSPDGSEILVATVRAYLISADGSEQRALSHGRQIVRAAWSPDGTKIAIRDSFGISIVSRDGTDPRVLAEADSDGWLRAVQPAQPKSTEVPATDSPTPASAEPSATPSQG